MDEVINYISQSQIITTALLFLITLTIKDLSSNFVSNFSAGLSFYFDKCFVEGDTIIIDGQRATILKIGLTRTTLLMTETNNWKYIYNNRIKFCSLEKEMKNNSPT